MKNKDISNLLKSYDENKGSFRTYIKDEPHIRDLRNFEIEVSGDERDLTGKELVALCSIILSKNDRTMNSESSKTFTVLADYFGGYDTLEFLKSNELLVDEYLVFFAKYASDNKELITQIIIIIGKLFTSTHWMSMSDYLAFFIDAFQKTSIKENRGALLKFFETIVFANTIEARVTGILFIEHLKNKKILDHLINHIINLNKIIFHMSQVCPELITLDNLRTLVLLNNPDFFYHDFSKISASQEHLDLCISIDNKNYQSPYALNIIRVFLNAQWDWKPYLEEILNFDTDSGKKVYSAINKLHELIPEASDNLDSIVASIIQYPLHSSDLIEAIKALNRLHLPATNWEILAVNPQHALVLAELFGKLHPIKGYDADLAQTFMRNSPERAPKMLQIMECLNENNLFTYANVYRVFETAIVHENTVELFKTLTQNNLLTRQDILTGLFDKAAQISIILDVVNILLRIKKLDLRNLIFLTASPETADTRFRGKFSKWNEEKENLDKEKHSNPQSKKELRFFANNDQEELNCAQKSNTPQDSQISAHTI
ncbi:MAG TPA: hypothetical protein PK657_10740 [Legionella sp.]|nr:hypothetical protein [Legionella sp.]